MSGHYIVGEICLRNVFSLSLCLRSKKMTDVDILNLHDVVALLNSASLISGHNRLKLVA